MYIYNLTAVIGRNIHNQWLDWIKQIYIHKVYETNKIKSVRIFKIMNMENDITYAIHHETESPQDLLHFIKNEIPTLKQLSMENFGDKVLMFGTELKEISL
ncbi:hypothetical protein CAPN001_16120 [Capnocytophaga stomatis]|uniref:DUF4286 family protein n=1 Tax=Capnocytophaga stomatis TaxID=1848904 RepID=UPI001950F672|nr:DUF4286 family protein [Capnocytophaga stomatis]GIJ97043.1 hypothetical protein CAPN001_16120 [Capnocytophaga stomatis]